MTSTRRTFLAGLALPTAATGLALPAVLTPAVATEPHPDAELLALCRDCLAAASAYDEAHSAAKNLAAREEPNRPPRSDALRRAGDFEHFYSQATNPHSPVFYEGREAQAFKGFEPLAGMLCPRDREQARIRAAEIVAAHEQWDDECCRFEEATGITEADRRADVALDHRSELGEAVMALPATTMEGLLAKSRVGAELEWETFDRSVLNDLLALGGQA